MSKAGQQRVIEQKDSTIRQLRQELAQAKADVRAASDVYIALTALCDEYNAANQAEIPVTILRQIRPAGTGLGGGRA